MPVKRRISKRRPWKITPEIVELYKRCEELKGIYSSCIRVSGICKSPVPSRFCAECLEFLQKHVALDNALGLEPWEASPTDADQPAPKYENLYAQSWSKAVEMRKQLKAAAKRGRGRI